MELSSHVSETYRSAFHSRSRAFSSCSISDKFGSLEEMDLHPGSTVFSTEASAFPLSGITGPLLHSLC